MEITMHEIRKLASEQARLLNQDEDEVRNELISVLQERGWIIPWTEDLQ